MKDNDFPGEMLFFSAVAGGFAAPAKALFHRLLLIPGLMSNYYDQLNLFLIAGHHRLPGIWNWIFGELGDIILGAGFGIILGWWLSNSRPKYYWGIGLSFGFGFWLFTLAFGNLTHEVKLDRLTPYALFAHLLAMLIYGVNFVLAALYWRPLQKRLMAVRGLETPPIVIKN